MRTPSTIPRYSLWVIGFYVVISPLFFIFAPDVLQYHFTPAYNGQVLAIVLGTFLGFYIVNEIFDLQRIEWQHVPFIGLIKIVCYAALIAIPEEIIFRGLVQGFVQQFFQNIPAIVVISALVFGLAHVPNGARGVQIKNWNWQFSALTFLAGLPLGLIFAITQSLLVPTLLHASFLIFFKLCTAETSEFYKKT